VRIALDFGCKRLQHLSLLLLAQRRKGRIRVQPVVELFYPPIEVSVAEPILESHFTDQPCVYLSIPSEV
jgi:hypothetical protein